MAKMILAVLVPLLFSIACSSVPKLAGELATDDERAAYSSRLQKELGLSIVMADPMPHAAMRSINSALFVMKWHKFRPVSSDHPFIRFFGSNSVDAIYGFIKDRVHHFGVMRPDLESETGTYRTYALNAGSMLWIVKHASYVNAFRLGGSQIDEIDSPRYGLIQLSPSTLVEANRSGELDADRFFHLAIIVHEARHSDCTGGVKRSIIGELGSLPSTCTYSHSSCASDDGESFPCDHQHWGAYAAQYAVLDALADTCTSCDDSTRMELKLDAIGKAKSIATLPESVVAEIRRFLKNSRAVARRHATQVDALLSQINSFLMSGVVPDPDLTSGDITD